MTKRRSLTQAGSRPAKRPRAFGDFSEFDDGPTTIPNFPSTRREVSQGRVQSLVSISLRVSAFGLLQSLRIPVQTVPKGAVGARSSMRVGWDVNRDNTGKQQMEVLRQYIEAMPSRLANQLLALLLDNAAVEKDADALGSQSGALSVLSLATTFLHSNTTSLRLSGLSVSPLLLSRIPQCTHLAELDLSSNFSLSDKILATIIGELPTLQKVGLRGCSKIGDQTAIALSRATEERLLSLDMSETAVTIKGLVAILARCKSIEVLKLAGVKGFKDTVVDKLVDEATSAAFGWRHIPLSNLRCLKLRSTDINESSLGRLVALCALKLQRLDISFTQVKTLDLLSHALHTVSEWRLEKLVASGLPLSSDTLVKFFAPLAERPLEQRNRFQRLKLCEIPARSPMSPGLTDSVLTKLLPALSCLGGLEALSLLKNNTLGRITEPMWTLLDTVGRRCKHLDLSHVPVNDTHLECFLDDLASDRAEPSIETLILNHSKITDHSAFAIAQCHKLRALHVANTSITPKFLIIVMKACPLLSTLDVTSCRGVPIAWRRTFFEVWERGEVQDV